MPFYPSLGEGSPTKIDYRKKGTLILTSLLEDLVNHTTKDQDFVLRRPAWDKMNKSNSHPAGSLRHGSSAGLV